MKANAASPPNMCDEHRKPSGKRAVPLIVLMESGTELAELPYRLGFHGLRQGNTDSVLQAGQGTMPKILPHERLGRGAAGRSRPFIEQLWQECAPFVDANATDHAMQNLPAVFWELYLAHALRRVGISITQQQRTKKQQRGPDLRAEQPDVWLAVAPTPGTGQDALRNINAQVFGSGASNTLEFLRFFSTCS